MIQIQPALCRDCFECIRACPAGAIVRHGEEMAAAEDCIGCGACVSACPQGAVRFEKKEAEVVSAIRQGKRVALVVDPAALTAWPGVRRESLFSAFEALGFGPVTGTKEGELMIRRETLRLAGKMENCIASDCPALNLLVEQEYPELVPYLCPVVSPVVAQARLMRKTQPELDGIAYLAPCLAVQREWEREALPGAPEYVLTIEQADALLKERKISLEREEAETLRPVPVQQSRLRTVRADGSERCRAVLEALGKGEKGYFLELRLCPGGCRGSAALKRQGGSLLERYAAPAQKVGPLPELPEVCPDLSRSFSPCLPEEPSEEKIQAALAVIGRQEKAAQISCGACGYRTCQALARAICRGRAEARMCLPFAREQAGRMSGFLADHTPNGVVILDREKRVLLMNPAARALLRAQEQPVEGIPFERFLRCEGLEQVDKAGGRILDVQRQYPELSAVVEESVLAVEEHEMYLILLRDVTEEEQRRESRMQLCSDTAELAQKVIEKQMRVAQEIASLLGETTAETKLALNRLKRSILDEMSGERP